MAENHLAYDEAQLSNNGAAAFLPPYIVIQRNKIKEYGKKTADKKEQERK